MSKASTPSFIVELEIDTDSHIEAILRKRMNIARQIYNACLGEALKGLHKVRMDKGYRHLLEEPSTKERNAKLREIERAYGYSEYQLHSWAAQCGRHFHGAIGANEVQKLATRAFKAVQKVQFGTAHKVRFKPIGDYISVEGKTNSTGLYWKDGIVHWGKGVQFGVRIKKNDIYAKEALAEHRVKYLRLVQKVIRGRERFYIQFILEGTPPEKKTKDGAPRHAIGIKDAIVGIDPGTTTMAIVSEQCVELAELAPGLRHDERKRRRIQQAMDRSRRASNPDHYNADGTIKRNTGRWVNSNRYKKLAAELREANRSIAAKRKQSHEILANQIIALGLDVRTEQMQYQELQKRSTETKINPKTGRCASKKQFGKTLENRAPAMFLEILDRKLHYFGAALRRIDTASVKASQFDHTTGECHEKTLRQRYAVIQNRKLQRDLYSAFLIACTDDALSKVDVSEANNKYSQFLILHDAEVQSIKADGSKTLKWYVA